MNSYIKRSKFYAGKVPGCGKPLIFRMRHGTWTLWQGRNEELNRAAREFCLRKNAESRKNAR